MSEQAAPWAKNPEPGATTPKGTNTLISTGAADTGAEPMVTIDNVSKIFGKGKKEVAAVKNVSLTVKKGEIFAIIGYSGAGKSTLVRLINGLESTTSGTLTVDGFEISGKRDLELQKVRTNIGMIFQQFNLMNSRTVAQNVEFPLKVAGWSKGERTKRVQEMLEFVGLADRAKYYPSQLSGGQKQRVGIARALATKPSLLLADEATSALDPETTHEVLELLKEVNRELGITVIVITHEMDVVSSIADRVAVMEESADRGCATIRGDHRQAEPHRRCGCRAAQEPQGLPGERRDRGRQPGTRQNPGVPGLAERALQYCARRH